jgi:peptidoglycan biosynthesis protein MviN/MurJ (putative lipid II flippase)
VLAALTVDGVLSAVAGSMFLPLHLGPVPFPISALLSGVVNAALVWAALQWHDSPRVAALPLLAWLLVVFVLVVIGPQDGVVLGGSGIAQVSPLLLMLLGALPPALVLRRAAGHRRADASD